MANELIARFSAYQKLRGFSNRTIDRRFETLSQFKATLNGLRNATVDDIEFYLARFDCAATRCARRSDLNQFYKHLVQRGIITTNPCDLVPSPRVPRRSASPIDAADINRAINASTGPVHLMIMLGALAGLRTSEIAHIRGEHIHRDAGLLVVIDGKGGKDETVPLAARLATELEHWPTRGALFPGLNRHGVYDRIKAVFRRLDIEARPHDLRHSYGTYAAIASGGNLKLVQRLMRHDTIKSTERYVGWQPPGGEILDMLYPETPDAA